MLANPFDDRPSKRKAKTSVMYASLIAANIRADALEVKAAESIAQS